MTTKDYDPYSGDLPKKGPLISVNPSPLLTTIRPFTGLVIWECPTFEKAALAPRR